MTMHFRFFLVLVVFAAFGIVRSPSLPAQVPHHDQSGHTQTEEPGTPQNLVFGMDQDYIPLSFLDDGEARGFDIDLVKALSLEMGVAITKKPDTWHRTLESLETGGVDAVSGIVKSAGRAENMDFSIPYLVESYTVFYRKNLSVTLGSLEGFHGVILKGDIAIEKYVVPSGLSESVELVPTYSEAFQLIEQGKADYTIAPFSLGRYVLRDRGYQHVAESGRSLFSVAYRFGVEKGNQELLSTLNDALSSLIAKGKTKELSSTWQFFQYFPLSQASPPSQFLLLMVSSIFGIALGAIVGILLYRIKSQNHIHRLERGIAEGNKMLQIIPIPLMWKKEGDSRLGVNAELYTAIRELSPAKQSSWDGIAGYLKANGYREVEQIYPGDSQSSRLILRAYKDQKEIETLSSTVEQLSGAVSQKDQTIQELSVRDDLTGLFNRTFMYRQIDHEVVMTQRYDYAFSLILLDIRGFSSINLQSGFDRADELCCAVAEVASTHVREADILSRISGGRFLLLLPNTRGHQAYKTTEKLAMEFSRTARLASLRIDAAYIECDGQDRSELLASLEHTLTKHTGEGDQAAILHASG